MTAARFIVGDSLTVLRSLPDASVDLVLTSPPFLALRSYLPADHPDKDKEIGGEGSPGAFIDSLLDIVEECRRVLAPHGSICFELGDTYSGSGGSGGDYNEGGLRAGQAAWSGTAKKAARLGHDSDELRARGVQAGRGRKGRQDRIPTRSDRPEWPADKSLCLIPELFRIALVYGLNPLTGRETPRWRARNVIRWCRPNPPVGELHDKFRPATSEMVVACVGRRRFFDLDAVRTVPKHGMFLARNAPLERTSIPGRSDQLMNPMTENGRINSNPAGAPPLDWWEVSTAPYRGAHYATWPEALLHRPVLAMCPQRVCTTCGHPAERIVERTTTGQNIRKPGHPDAGKQVAPVISTDVPDFATRETIGWTDCGHDTWRAGVVLDPFAGSGTTLAVAVGHGRSAIGIDLDARNADLAGDRVGMFLTVEHHQAACP